MVDDAFKGRLCAHFVRCIGITSKEEFQKFLVHYDASQGNPIALLVASLAPSDLTQPQWKTELVALEVLLANQSTLLEL